MRVLSIGTDRKLFIEKSSVLERSLNYASKTQELHIIVFSIKNQGLENKKINNLYLHPTNSLSKLFFIFDAIKIGTEIIKKYEFSINSSVITCQDPFETGLVGMFLKKRFHFPLQLQIHTDFLSPYFKNNILNRVRVFISKFTIPKADGIRVVSSVIKDSILEKFKNLKAKIDILPIWVDVDKFFRNQDQSHITEKTLTILMASRFSKEKRIDIALEVFKKIIDTKKDVQMLIVGDGQEKENIQKKITDLNLWNNTKLLGWEKDMVQVYQEANIFLLTSDFEGYGMTLIEAGASGCPIVTTKVGLAKTDLFKDGLNSYVCPVGDVDCLSEKLLDLITNSDKRKSFAENMRDSIKYISVSKEEYISQYMNLLNKIIKK